MAEPTPPDAAPSDNRTILIVLSYLWILALVPLLVEKLDREVQWHARHGIVLMVGEFAFWIVFNIAFGVTMGFGCAGCLLGPVIGLVFLAVHLVAMIKGVRGERLLIPYVSQFADKF
jgi:uncharacterized membrane protein